MAPALSLSMSRNGHSRVSLDECYLLTRQLHVLQKSGVPLLSSLHALEAQVPSPSAKTILRRVRADLAEGRTFAQALARHPRAFGPVYLGLIRVGEAGGLLEEALRQLTELLEWEIELRRRLQEALQYPVIVLSTLTVAITLMVTFVLPRFAHLFRAFHVELPLQTRLLIALANGLSRYGWLAALLVALAAVAVWRYVRSDTGRLRWHAAQLRLPVIGPVLLQLSMSRFARITAALNHSGVPILETLALAGQSVNNRCVRQAIDRLRGRVSGGDRLAGALKREPLFPPVVVQMVATGEETGRLDELLQSVSDYYGQQANFLMRKAITYLEPALLILVGMGVLLMATAVLVPMWDLVRTFKQTGG